MGEVLNEKEEEKRERLDRGDKTLCRANVTRISCRKAAPQIEEGGAVFHNRRPNEL